MVALFFFLSLLSLNQVDVESDRLGTTPFLTPKALFSPIATVSVQFNKLHHTVIKSYGLTLSIFIYYL
jgi:hypothetical protein